MIFQNSQNSEKKRQNGEITAFPRQTAEAAMPSRMPCVDELVKTNWLAVLLCLVIQHTTCLLHKGVAINILLSVHCAPIHFVQIRPTLPSLCFVPSDLHHLFSFLISISKLWINHLFVNKNDSDVLFHSSTQGIATTVISTFGLFFSKLYFNFNPKISTSFSKWLTPLFS